MTWSVVARHDGRTTVGERSVRLLLGLLAFVIVLAGYMYPLAGTPPYTTARFGGFAVGWLTTVVPLVGLLLGYNAVVTDRESGAIRLSLSLPHSRRDLLLGTAVSRVGLVAATVVAAMVVAGWLVVYPFGELALPRFVLFVCLSVVYGAIWTGLGIAVSFTVATRRRALVLAFTLFFLFVLVWDPAVEVLELGLNTVGAVDGDLPAPVRFVTGLTPGNAFERATTGLVDPSASVDGPWYLGPWVALVLLAGWVVVPMELAFRRFAGSDLA
jgi:ABC-2 type transport system permease protein